MSRSVAAPGLTLFGRTITIPLIALLIGACTSRSPGDASPGGDTGTGDASDAMGFDSARDAPLDNGPDVSEDLGADASPDLISYDAADVSADDGADAPVDVGDVADAGADASVDAPTNDVVDASCPGDAALTSSEWSGTIRFGTSADSSYLRLTACGDRVFGEACESPTRDCYPLVNGTFAGASLHFEYTFGSGASVSRVTADLTMMPGGATMTGSVSSTRCGCSGMAMYTRVP